MSYYWEYTLGDLIQIDSLSDYILFGEDHTKSNAVHKKRIVTYLSEKDFSSIGIEYPVSFEKKLNDYLTFGDESVLKDIKKSSFRAKRDYLQHFRDLRKINKELEVSKRLKIICFDVESKASSRRPFRAVNYFLESFNKNELTELYRIIDSSRKGKKYSVTSLRCLEGEVLNNAIKYRIVFGEYYDRLLKVIEGSIIEVSERLVYSTEEPNYDVLRENFLASNFLEDTIGTNTIIFCGSFHADYIYNFPSYGMDNGTLAAQLKRNSNAQIISVLPVYLNTKKGFLEDFFGGTYADALVNKEQIKLNDYRILKKNEFIDSKELQKRCDVILLKDCKGKRR